MDNTSAIPSSASDPAETFRALADTTRLRIVQLLLLEELNVTELVEILGLPQSSVSRHLKALRDVGLVHDRRVGATSLHAALHSNGRHATGQNDALEPMLMTWLSSRPLSPAIKGRLDKVIQQRRADAAGVFNRLGRRWDELRCDAFGSTYAWEAFLALLPHSWTVADLGTGTGYLLPTLSAHFQRVVAIESADVMLECARQRISSGNLPNIELHAGDLTQLPLAENAIDLSIAMLVLHHVPDTNQALREISRVTRPGGRVLIVEQQAHENQAFYERMQDHWWGFDANDLCGRLRGVGFCQLHARRLTTTTNETGAADAPPLFVLTGIRTEAPAPDA